jgi:hypothetical protein
MNFVMNDGVLRYERLIHKLINKVLGASVFSDPSFEREDAVQLGRQYVWEALRDFNPTCGSKEMSFVYLKLQTKFLNLKDKMKTRGRHFQHIEDPDCDLESLSSPVDSDPSGMIDLMASHRDHPEVQHSLALYRSDRDAMSSDEIRIEDEAQLAFI